MTLKNDCNYLQLLFDSSNLPAFQNLFWRRFGTFSEPFLSSGEMLQYRAAKKLVGERLKIHNWWRADAYPSDRTVIARRIFAKFGVSLQSCATLRDTPRHSHDSPMTVGAGDRKLISLILIIICPLNLHLFLSPHQ